MADRPGGTGGPPPARSSVRATRRRVLGAGLGLGAAGLLASGCTDEPTRGGPRAYGAPTLHDSVGIVIHLHFLDTVYADHDRVLEWLQRLGVRHVRTRLTVDPSVLDAFEEIGRRGMRVQGVCGAFGDDQPMDLLMRTVAERFADPAAVFSGFEGINEPNNKGVPWIEETRTKTEQLHAARGRHGLEAVPIVAPALSRMPGGGVEGSTSDEQSARLGDLGAWADYGSMHVYPRGLPPSQDVERFAGYARRIVPGAPVMCTEGGYFTAMGYRGTAFPVPREIAAVYGPQAVLEHWDRGTARYFRYELLDEPTLSGQDRESAFGLVSTGSSWTPKPEFEPMRRLLAAIADAEPDPTRDRFPVTLEGGPEDLRHATVRRRDGSLVVALWLDRVVWDPRARRLLVEDLRAPLASVGVRSGRGTPVTVEHLVTPGALRTVPAAERTAVDLPAGVTLVTLG